MPRRGDSDRDAATHEFGSHGHSPHISPYSGAWYPGEASELGSLLDRMWVGSEGRTGTWLAPGALAFVVPHAGLVYSGVVAAAAFRHIAACRPGRVILLGFSHRAKRRGILIPDLQAIRTPVGDVAVDAETAATLTQYPEFDSVEEDAVCDHSVEIQLPMLKRAAPDARITPVYINGADPEIRRSAARRLASLAGPDTVFLASSDLTHFGRSFGFQPFPVDGSTAARLSELDGKVMDAMGSLDADLFLDAIRATSATVCGVEPIALLLDTLRNREGPEIFQERLDYQASGEITGDFHNSVSYGSLGYFPYSAFELDEAGRELLLESARATLRAYQQTGKREPRPSETPHPGLDARLGAFVTIHANGQLRGCVGSLRIAEPLKQLIPDMTLAAACDDSRFRAVTGEEQGLSVEISLLSPLKRMRSRADFRVNEHGALLKAGRRQGLLLPQVATEYGWGADKFFDALARKSGLSPDVYDEPGTELYVFRAQHF